MKNCKRPSKIAQKVNALLKENPRSAKYILFEICQQWENSTIEDTQEMDPENDQLENECQDTNQYTADQPIIYNSEDEQEESD